MNEWKVEDRGWLSGVIGDIRAGNDFVLVASWQAAQAVAERAKASAEQVGGSKALLEAIRRLAGSMAGPLGAALPDATAITGMLAAVGAVGAMEGCVLFVLGWAHFEYDLDIGMRVPKGVFDPGALSVRIVATKRK